MDLLIIVQKMSLLILYLEIGGNPSDVRILGLKVSNHIVFSSY